VTPEFDSRDDTAPDPRSPPPGAGDSAHQRILKDVIKAALFPGEAVPVTIGRFRVLRPIGAGGMSVVYAAYDEKLDRRIALKLLRGGESPDSQTRLLREAQAMARVAHPNVVAVHEVGRWGDQVYVAMEFVRGRDLRTWLAEGRRDPAEVVEVFAAAGRGLAAAHAAGLVHRDFKPANVLLGDDGRARVVDFGLVRQSDDEPAQAPDLGLARAAAAGRELTASLTATGALVGTPAYMSPEQHEGRPADARSDQFSFCVALYEALYAAHPFAGATVVELAEAVLAGRIGPVPEDSRVPGWLRRVVLRGLSVDPAARWPAMDDLIDELGRDPERIRRARVRAGLLAGAVGAVVVGLLWLARQQADVARVAQQAEAAADRQRREAEDSRADAEAARDRALAALKAQLAATEAALAERERALAAAEEARGRAEDESAAAEAQRLRAEDQRRRAERERGEAERQTARAVQEARRARDATRLAQALGAAAGDPTTVLALLRETEDPAGTPGWVPAAVDTLLQPVSLAVLRAHRGTVHAAAFSPDGRRVATAADDHLAALWDWTTNRVHTREHAAPVKFLAFGPGDLWVSGAADGVALVGAGEAAPRRLVHGGELRALALAPDGRRLATASTDGRVRVWDLAAGDAPRDLAGRGGAVLSAMFDRSGRKLVTAAADGSARVWDLGGDGPPRVLAHPRGAVRVAVFDPAGARVATGAQDGAVRVWSLADVAAAPTVEAGHTGEVVALAWSPDGGALVSASLDGTARVWGQAPGRKDRALRGHAGRIYAAQWSPGGDRVVTASQDGTARVWPEAGPPRVLRGHAEELGAAAFSPDGDRVVTASRDGSVRVWQVRRTGEDVQELRPGGRPQFLAWTPSGDALLSARADGVVHLWRPDAGAAARRLAEPGPAPLWLGADAREARAIRSDGLLLRWPLAGGPPVAASLAPATPALTAAALQADGARAALATADALWLLAPATGARTPLRGHTGTVSAVAFGPAALLTGATDRSARAWNLSLGTSTRALGPHSGGVTAVAWTPDGRALATAAWDKRARVWTGDAELPVVLAGHTGPVWALAFRPDGDFLATGGDDRSVRVWPVDGGDDPVVLAGHAGPVRALAFRPDGAVLASAGDDGAVRLWNADFTPAGLQARLRRASPVCLSARQRVSLLGEDPDAADRSARACEAAP
jgi:WD40 repeat protein/tRNA A-37 threonylcarbamoyl transferase component Bud32